jgi:hypothetical protein
MDDLHSRSFEPEAVKLCRSLGVMAAGSGFIPTSHHSGMQVGDAITARANAQKWQCRMYETGSSPA